MPSTSIAQRAKMAQLFREGKITKAQWARFQVVRTRRRKMERTGNGAKSN